MTPPMPKPARLLLCPPCSGLGHVAGARAVEGLRRGAEGTGEGVLGRQSWVPGQRQRGPCQQGACPEAEGEHAIPRQLCESITQLRHLSLPAARAALLPRPPHCCCLRCRGHGVPARPLAGAHRGARSAPARCSEHKQTRRATDMPVRCGMQWGRWRKDGRSPRTSLEGHVLKQQHPYPS